MPYNKAVFGQLIDLLKAQVEQIRLEFDASSVTMWVYDVASEEFDLPVSCELSYEDSFCDVRNRPLKDGYAARIMLSGKVHFVEDRPEKERLNVPFVIREGIRSYAAI